MPLFKAYNLERVPDAALVKAQIFIRLPRSSKFSGNSGVQQQHTA